jgi:hypothetical protein
MTPYHLSRRNELVADGWGFHESHGADRVRVTVFNGRTLEKFERPTSFEAWAQALTFAQLQSEIDRIERGGLFCHERDHRHEEALAAE